MLRSRTWRSSLSLPGSASSPEKKPALVWTSAPAMTFSMTGMWLNSPTPCRVREMPMPDSWCGRSPWTTSPRQLRVPSSGFWKPQTTLKSVVFPAPFGPITPRTSPGST